MFQMLAPTAKSKVIYLDIDKIQPNPYQPRQIFDTEALSELAVSIKQYGILQPISVRKSGSAYELIAGERRLRAARMAGLNSVPVLIHQMDSDRAGALALIENIQRENLSYIEEAEAYQWLLENQHLTQEELAEKIGKKQSTIANKLRLLKLSDAVKSALVRHSLTERHARALLQLPDEHTQLQVIETIVALQLNVNQSEEYIKNLVAAPKPPDKPVRKKIVKDVRIIVNTIKQTIDMIKKSGIDAKTVKHENDAVIEYVITIHK